MAISLYRYKFLSFVNELANTKRRLGTKDSSYYSLKQGLKRIVAQNVPTEELFVVE
jgi:hypothetical protein